MADIIPGLKLIKHTGSYDAPDDATLPFKLTVNFSPPALGGVTWALMHGGSEVVIVRGETHEAIDAFIAKNAFASHPRFRWLIVEEYGKLVTEQRRAGW